MLLHNNTKMIILTQSPVLMSALEEALISPDSTRQFSHEQAYQRPDVGPINPIPRVFDLLPAENCSCAPISETHLKFDRPTWNRYQRLTSVPPKVLGGNGDARLPDFIDQLALDFLPT